MSQQTAQTPPDQGSSGKARNDRQLLRRVIDGGLAVLLIGALATVLAFDQQKETPPPVVTPPPPPLAEEPPPPPPVIIPANVLPPVDPVHRVVCHWSADGRFGLSTTAAGDESGVEKRLTFGVSGGTNNTRIWIDGDTPEFGSSFAGSMIEPIREGENGRIVCAWKSREIVVHQSVEYAAGDVSRQTDCIRVEYRMENTGTQSRQVGLRMMLDSLIGSNDGVPFIVPGQEHIVTSPTQFTQSSVPDFVRALEFPDLVHPGVIADLKLALEGVERPSKVVLSHWPGSNAGWAYSQTTPLDGDSAIGVYYDPAELAAGASRTVAFTYGLGTISSTKSKNIKLSLTAGGPFRSGGKFWIVALVQRPKGGETVGLELPDGLTLAAGDPATKPVTAGTDYCQVSWLVSIAAGRMGPAVVKAHVAPVGSKEQFSLTIQPPDARLTVSAKTPLPAGKKFWVSALVQNPRAGQSVELKLPPGFSAAAGSPASQPVPVKGDYAQLNWLIEPQSRVQPGDVKVSVRLQPDGIEASTTLQFEASLIK